MYLPFGSPREAQGRGIPPKTSEENTRCGTQYRWRSRDKCRDNMKYQTHKRQVSSMNLRQGGREKTPRRNETMIRLIQIIQCNKSGHWFFTLAKQKSPVRIPSFLYYSVFLLPVFSLPTLTETIPCATIWAPKGKNIRFLVSCIPWR